MSRSRGGRRLVCAVSPYSVPVLMRRVSLRIPTKYSGGKEYQEKIWDHASGSLLIEESGGVCSDMHGKPLDFSLGRTLKGNEGIVAAGKESHERALKAVKQAVAEAKREKL